MPKNCWKKIEVQAVTVTYKSSYCFQRSKVQVSFVVVLRKLPWPDTSWCFHSRASLASEIEQVLSGNKESA